MTIKEALVRQPQLRPTEVANIVDRQYEYQEILRQKGIAILEEAFIPSMLGELLEVIKLAHPDVRLPAEREESRRERRRKSQEKKDENDNRYRLFGDGSVHISLGWNYRKGKRHPAQTLIWDEVTVTAEPLTETLFVSGKECEKITKDLWSSEEGRATLEDALVEAMGNPGQGSPPMHM